MKKNPTLIENLVYTDKNSCKRELTISSKVESVESIFSSLVSQDNSFFFSIARPFLSQVFVVNYSCLKCDKHDNVDSVRCDKCDKWIHKTCAKISDKKYKDMPESKPGEEIWLCNVCLDFHEY